MIYQRGDKAVTRNNLARCVLTVTQGGSERAAPAQAGLAHWRDSSDDFWAIASAEGMQSRELIAVRELLSGV